LMERVSYLSEGGRSEDFEPPFCTARSLPALIPPFRYAIVEPGISRGAYPTLRNYRFLDRLHLRTIISLVPQYPIVDLQEYCQHSGIELIHREVMAFSDEAAPLRPEEAIEIVELLIDTSRHPIYLHCMDGTHVTGLVVMCLRRLQNWALGAAKAEARRFLPLQIMEKVESKFIEGFEGDLNLPEVLPVWLWGGLPILVHSCLRLKRMGVVEVQVGDATNEGTSSHKVPKDGLHSGSRAPSPAPFQQTPGRSGELANGELAGLTRGILNALDASKVLFSEGQVQRQSTETWPNKKAEPRKFAQLHEALMLETLTMRGCLHESSMIRASGATRRGPVLGTIGLY